MATNREALAAAQDRAARRTGASSSTIACIPGWVTGVPDAPPTEIVQAMGERGRKAATILDTSPTAQPRSVNSAGLAQRRHRVNYAERSPSVVTQARESRSSESVLRRS